MILWIVWIVLVLNSVLNTAEISLGQCTPIFSSLIHPKGNIRAISIVSVKQEWVMGEWNGLDDHLVAI